MKQTISDNNNKTGEQNIDIVYIKMNTSVFCMGVRLVGWAARGPWCCMLSAHADQ